MRTTDRLGKCGTADRGPRREPVRAARAPRNRRQRAAGIGRPRASCRIRRRRGSSIRPPRPECPQPMRRIHPAGLFEAICPLPPAGSASKYLLQTADERGNRATMHDPYAFPNVLTEYDLYLLNEGTHWQQLRPPGGAPAHGRRRSGGQFRRLGPQRHGRQHHRRLQRLGRPPPPDAQAHSQRLLGIVRAGPGRGHALQVPREAWRPGVREVRPLRLRRGTAAADRVEGRQPRPVPLARRRLDGAAAWRPTSSTRRCRSTKSTWAAGSGPATIHIAG